MLHLITPLYRYKNLSKIYSSIPPNEDIIWHIAKTNKRKNLTDSFIDSNPQIKVYEIDCEDNDLITKRNTVFDEIKSGHFHLLDDDTLFHNNMYQVYKDYEDFNGMIVGKQVYKNNKTRLNASYPVRCYIDAGNVLCHSSVLEQVRWEERDGYEHLGCKDFIFWENCFKIFGQSKTILIPDIISVYNQLSRSQ